MTQTGILAGADAVLDPGMGSVTGFEELGGCVGGVGGQELVAPAVVFFEQGQLRAGVGFFAAADDAQIGRPVRQLVAMGPFPEQRGELDDPGLGQVAGPAVTVEDDSQAEAGIRSMPLRSRAPNSQPME